MFNASRSMFKRPGTELVEVQCFAFNVQCFAFNVQMFSCSNVLLFNCSLVQLFKCSLVQCSNVLLFKCSLVQLFKCSLVQLFKCSLVQLFKCSLVQLFSCSIVQMFSCSNVLLYPYSIVLIQFSILCMVNFLSNHFQIPKSPNPHIPTSSIFHIPTSPNPHIPKFFLFKFKRSFYFLSYFPIRLRSQFAAQMFRKTHLIPIRYTGCDEIHPGLHPKCHDFFSCFENACSQRVHFNKPEYGIRGGEYFAYYQPNAPEIGQRPYYP